MPDPSFYLKRFVFLYKRYRFQTSNYDEKEKRRWRECYLVEIEDQVQFTNLIIKKLYKGIGVNVSSK